MKKKRIWLSPPHMGGEEVLLVQDAFASNWIAPLGPHVDAFERELSAYTHATDVAALSSGTAAIHLALILLGVQAGDEVICQSLTFSASANPIVYLGATPVFVDSEAQTWNMDPGLLEEAVRDRLKKGKRPKAIIVVHLYGMPARMAEIKSVARRYEIPIIEDAAEALGSRYDGTHVGIVGEMGVLSFNGNKIITTSGGGALMSMKREYTEKARFLATQARDPAPHYQHSQIGYNYRLSNVLAAIGRGQLKVLDQRVEQRRRLFDYYRFQLADHEGITFTEEPRGMFSNRWLTTILIEPEKTGGISREDIRNALEADNIEARPLWKPMHMQPVFKDAPAYVNGTAERLFRQGLCLPSGTNMSEEDKSRIVGVIRKRLGEN